jgi:hypothetical protein
MARANVKIKTAKVLDLLRKKQTETLASINDREAIKRKHNAERQAWEKKVVSVIGKTAKPSEVEVRNVSYGEQEGSIKVILTHYLPASKVPAEPEVTLENLYTLKSRLEELNKTIALLELTDDETVSASAYRNIADLL